LAYVHIKDAIIFLEIHFSSKQLYILSLINKNAVIRRTCTCCPIITEVVSSNPVHGDVYSIQQYVIKFVSDLRQISGFLQINSCELLIYIIKWVVSLDLDIKQLEILSEVKETLL
jgi:hypothetical protein